MISTWTNHCKSRVQFPLFFFFFLLKPSIIWQRSFSQNAAQSQASLYPPPHPLTHDWREKLSQFEFRMHEPLRISEWETVFSRRARCCSCYSTVVLRGTSAACMLAVIGARTYFEDILPTYYSASLLRANVMVTGVTSSLPAVNKMLINLMRMQSGNETHTEGAADSQSAPLCGTFEIRVLEYDI